MSPQDTLLWSWCCVDQLFSFVSFEDIHPKGETVASGSLSGVELNKRCHQKLQQKEQ
jgi:hypothetical protein